jgi:broad specificity phosphatase PhoE
VFKSIFKGFIISFLMRIIMVRHGETKGNRDGIIQGQTDGDLNELGILQAKRVAERLKDEKVDLVFSSDLKRAYDTAKLITKYHENVPFTIEKSLRERSHGVYEGKKGDELDWSIQVEGQESIEELIKRAKDFIDKIYLECNDKSVIFVCHNGIGKALISVITGEDYFKIEKLHNTSVSIFEVYDEDENKVRLFNCKKHLEE